MPSTITDRLEGLTTSVAVKAPCRVATTANIALSGTQTIDGVAVAVGNRVLVKNQTSAVDNGIWVVGSGTWARATDFDGNLDTVGGTQVHVISGTVNANTYWRVAGTSTSITIGTDAITIESAGLSDSASHTFLQSGTGATARTAQAKMRDTVSVKDFGAVGDGVTNDIAAFNAAALAHAAITIPKGTYALGSAWAPGAGCSIIGDGSDNTILLFTGATDGLQFDNFDGLQISGLNLRTSNAAAVRALELATGSRGFVSDIQISQTGSGLWASGIWGNNWQTSNFYGLRINQSCTIPIHLEYACNANHFFGLEIVGGAGTTRGIQMDADNSLGAGRVTFECYFHGGTWQGNFSQSVLHSEGCAPIVHSIHVENTDGTPSDGEDLFLNGVTSGITNAKFLMMEGGSIGTSGTIRNLAIIGGAVTTIDLATGCQGASIVGTRYTSLTDTDGQTTVVGGSLSGGGSAPAIINADTSISFKINGDQWFQMSASGLNIAANAASTGAGQVRLGADSQTTVGAAGGASALPATPTGYLKFYRGTSHFVIPYYAQA